MSATYEALISEHRRSLERLARRLSRSREDAEDLLQESLLDAYRSFDRFRPGSQFYNWFARIMTNNQLDRVRRTREPMLSLDTCSTDPDSGPIEVPDERFSPETVLLRGVLDTPFKTALQRLDANQRATVELCDLEGATYEEAAAATNCPIGTIRSRLHRAHKSMERSLLPFVARAASGGRIRHPRREGGVPTASAASMVAGRGPAAGPSVVSAPERVRPVLEDGARRVTSIPEGLERLSETDVLVVTAAVDERLTHAQLSEIRSRVRDGGMGLVVLHAGESRVLHAVFGAPCGWDCAAATHECTLEITAPRHPVAGGVSDADLPRLQVCPGSFQGPRPEVVVLSSHPIGGASSWQGVAWNTGRGRVVCFRPAESIAEHGPLARLFANAVAWCGG